MCDVSKKDPLEGYSDDEKTLFHTERFHNMYKET